MTVAADDGEAGVLGAVGDPEIRRAIGPLVTPQQVLARAETVVEGYTSSELEQLTALSDYLSTDLVAAHPGLGRPGPVCPFVARALRRRAMFVAAWRGGSGDDAVAEAVAALRDALAPLWDAVGGHDVFRSVSLAFPHLPAAAAGAMAERVQARLKPSFVARGLMIGEFHPGSQTAGLHSADFRPFRAPVVNLSIRPMVVMDEPFLKDDEHSRRAYVARFPVEGPARLARCRATLPA